MQSFPYVVYYGDGISMARDAHDFDELQSLLDAGYRLTADEKPEKGAAAEAGKIMKALAAHKSAVEAAEKKAAKVNG